MRCPVIELAVAAGLKRPSLSAPRIGPIAVKRLAGIDVMCSLAFVCSFIVAPLP